MSFRRDQYSRKATRDVRGAMAIALRRHLEGLHFSDRQDYGFAQVFEEWPSFLERYVPPSCCVLPGAWKYDDSIFTPTLIECTWEPYGFQGFGLYQLSEAVVDFEIYIRCATTVEREEVLLGIEESFRAPNLLMDMIAGARNAVLQPLPEYYGLQARLSVTSARIIDDPDTAAREARDAIITISAQAPQVTVGPVYPMNSTVSIQYQPVIVEPGTSTLPIISFALPSLDLSEDDLPLLSFSGPALNLDEDDNPAPPPH